MVVQAKPGGTFLEKLYGLLKKEDNWCILVVADPDALGAAMALKRIIARRVDNVTIATVSEVTRPDNLAMIRYLRIPLKQWIPEMGGGHQHFALVDSQPKHHPAFNAIKFSLVIDHHPNSMQAEPGAAKILSHIQPDAGATCTMFVRYMQHLGIRPGRLLATAMLYGIRTDTAAFERAGGEADLKAYQYLIKYAELLILRRILRSEYLLKWLPWFGRAFNSLHAIKGKGWYSFVDTVDSTDILVAIADFFTRIHGLKGVVICGTFKHKVVIIFRSDGSRDMGAFASSHFGELGSAGGHKTMARAEFDLPAINEKNIGKFILQCLEKNCPSSGCAIKQLQ